MVAQNTGELTPEEVNRLRDHDAELARTIRLKDHFLAMLAHELRNPLAPILNAVQLLRSENPGDALDVIERQAKHMARLLEDLLDISRITQGKITLHKSRLDLTQSVRHAARSSLFEANHLFISEMSDKPLWVEADPVRIEQIIGNLLCNAAKYTEPGKEIRLSLEKDRGEAVLTVRDQGIGIPPEMLERIFEPFVQTKESLQRARGGLGLGLPLVRQLVAIHGGTVTAFSAGPGQGARFTVRLPLLESPVQNDPGESKRVAEGAPVPMHRVLVVEDNPDMATTLKQLLVAWGHSVEVAMTGAAATAIANKFQPDVVLIDIGLPDMTGYDVAKRLSDLSRTGKPELIAMSGYELESDRSRATQAGFNDYLLKPVDPAELRKRFLRQAF